MARPVIFVIGATGRVGSASVRRLSEKCSQEFELRAGVRDLSKAEHLKGLQGVTLVEAEMGGAGLKEIFTGVEALFIVTPPVERGTRVEKTIADAKAAGVKFFLVLSDACVVHEPPTLLGQESVEVEEKVRTAGVDACLLRLQSFYENMLCYAKSVKEESLFDGPCDGDKKFAQVAIGDIAKVSASVLADWRCHVNKTYTLTSQLVGHADVAKALSKSLERVVQYRRKPYDEIRESWLKLGWPAEFCDGLAEYYKLVDANDPVLTTADLSVVESLCGEAPTSFQKFVDSVSSSFASK